MLESADPEDPQGWNRYSYVFNNPTRYIDPTGAEAEPANDAEQKKKPRTIHFVQIGTVNVIGNSVKIYVATGQTKEYRDAVLKSAQAAAGVINANADKLTKEDRVNIGNVKVLADPGKGVGYSDTYRVEGIKELVLPRTYYTGTEVESGTFFNQLANRTDSTVVASEIGHEGKHIQDYKTNQGAYSLHPPLTPEGRSDLSEQRADRYQLGLYRKLSGSSPSSPDAYDLHLQRDLNAPHPHRPPIQH